MVIICVDLVDNEAAQLNTTNATHITLIRLIITLIRLIIRTPCRCVSNYSNRNSSLQPYRFTGRSRPQLGTLIELNVDEDG